MVNMARNIKQLHRATGSAILALAAFGLIAGCSQREEILQGKRLDLRSPLTSGQQTATPAAAVNRSVAIKLPKARHHKAWTHRNGSAEHRIIHPALSAAPQPIWSADIGAGDNRKHRITADPVVANGRVFTLDSAARVMAHSTAGKALWSADLTPASDRSGDASGGGLATDGQTLFVTSGFGAVVALDAASGAVKWRQKLEGAATGAPTLRDGLVYVVSRDSVAWAIDAKTGRVQWQLPGTPTPSVMVGGTAPAVTQKFALFPYGSGEIISAFRKGGVRVWASNISGKRSGRAYANFTDITADPVVDNGVVYAGSQSGRVVAVDLASGARLWTAKEGAYSPVWPVGGSVFLISDEADLLRLDAKTGEVIWRADLPYFVKDKPRKRKEVYTHYGPVLAGGRLLVASGDGQVRSFNPVNGALTSSFGIPGGATTNPVVVGGTLYLVSSKGKLYAFR